MKPLVSMRDALADPELLGTLLTGDSWKPWRVMLIAMMGEPLEVDERAIFTALTGRAEEPGDPVEEFWGVVGRRGGKTRGASVLSAYLAGLVDWSDKLVPGEIGKLFYLAHTAKQATIAMEYTRSIFTDIEVFANMVEKEPTPDCISLTNGIDLEVRAASWRGLRGVTSIAAIFDELAFFMSEETSANADKEILRAVRPSLATTGGPLIAISSPFGKAGEVYNTVQRDFGPNGDRLILVARGASRDFNPSLPQRVVDRAMELDAAAARAEYLGEFRDDLSAFIDIEVVEACMRKGVGAFLPAKDSAPYFAFVDPSGGRSDSMTLAIGHDEEGRDRVVLDCVVEITPPFEPERAVIRFADVLRSYGVRTVIGDAYAANWVRDAFRRHDIGYDAADLNKTEIFLDFLPLLNSRAVLMPDVPKLAQQLAGLQRRTTNAGRESIDHSASGHDDVANSAAGVLTHIVRKRRQRPAKSTTSIIYPTYSFFQRKR